MPLKRVFKPGDPIDKVLDHRFLNSLNDRLSCLEKILNSGNDDFGVIRSGKCGNLFLPKRVDNFELVQLAGALSSTGQQTANILEQALGNATENTNYPITVSDIFGADTDNDRKGVAFEHPKSDDKTWAFLPFPYHKLSDGSTTAVLENGEIVLFTVDGGSGTVTVTDTGPGVTVDITAAGTNFDVDADDLSGPFEVNNTDTIIFAGSTFIATTISSDLAGPETITVNTSITGDIILLTDGVSPIQGLPAGGTITFQDGTYIDAAVSATDTVTHDLKTGVDLFGIDPAGSGTGAGFGVQLGDAVTITPGTGIAVVVAGLDIEITATGGSYSWTMSGDGSGSVNNEVINAEVVAFSGTGIDIVTADASAVFTLKFSELLSVTPAKLDLLAFEDIDDDVVKQNTVDSFFALYQIITGATSGLNGGTTLDGDPDLILDINRLSVDVPVGGDFLAFNDITDNVTGKVTIDGMFGLYSLIEGAGISITDPALDDNPTIAMDVVGGTGIDITGATTLTFTIDLSELPDQADATVGGDKLAMVDDGVSSELETIDNVLGVRTINTTSPLSGGGDLSADRTIALTGTIFSIEGDDTGANAITAGDKIDFSGSGDIVTNVTGGPTNWVVDINADNVVGAYTWTIAGDGGGGTEVFDGELVQIISDTTSANLGIDSSETSKVVTVGLKLGEVAAITTPTTSDRVIMYDTTPGANGYATTAQLFGLYSITQGTGITVTNPALDDNPTIAVDSTVATTAVNPITFNPQDGTDPVIFAGDTLNITAASGITCEGTVGTNTLAFVGQGSIEWEVKGDGAGLGTITNVDQLAIVGTGGITSVLTGSSPNFIMTVDGSGVTGSYTWTAAGDGAGSVNNEVTDGEVVTFSGVGTNVVTGAGSIVVHLDIDDLASVSIGLGDSVAFADATASDVTKKDTVSSLLDLHSFTISTDSGSLLVTRGDTVTFTCDGGGSTSEVGGTVTISPFAAGMVVMWTGTVAAIPTGWTLLTSMKNKFPSGEGGTGTPGATGGADTFELAGTSIASLLSDHTAASIASAIATHGSKSTNNQLSTGNVGAHTGAQLDAAISVAAHSSHTHTIGASTKCCVTQSPQEFNVVSTTVTITGPESSTLTHNVSGSSSLTHALTMNSHNHTITSYSHGATVNDVSHAGSSSTTIDTVPAFVTIHFILKS